jgi:hypothetical protein
MVAAPERVGSPTVLTSVLLSDAGCTHTMRPIQGNRMSLESIASKSMAEEEQQYRNQRSVQEQAQVRAYQQWEQERERGREPRWER